MIKIIRVTLALILKPREEVEDVEGESCCRKVDHCWKPAYTEDLLMFGEGFIAFTVADNETMNT